jgi:glycosyltransferase involved in cell wall biosynthesis
MKKYGILFCGYNSEEYVEKSLSSFLNKDNFVISAVSVPFLEYKDQEPFEDETTNILRRYLHEGKIHYLVDFPKFIKEAEARDLALDYLLTEGVDYFWIVDADEIYSEKDIKNICEFVEQSKEDWFKISLKNFVFDTQTYLQEPFCPPRIFKTQSKNKFSHPRFIWDNDVIYSDSNSNETLHYTMLPNICIPQDVAWVDHYSWMNDNIGRRKVQYQQGHFGHCSFKWNEEKKRLEFDEEYFEKTKEPLPKVFTIT